MRTQSIMIRLLAATAIIVLCLQIIMPVNVGLADAAVLEPLSWDITTGYHPMQNAYLENNRGYHDDSIHVDIETFTELETKIYVARITISDPSQLRTCTAGKFPSKNTEQVDRMAKRVNAVLAVNGDYFCFHEEGIVMRNGVLLRNKPTIRRDTLIIDQNGDFTILTPSTSSAWDSAKTTAVHAFCFGPGLVVNGNKITEEALDASKLNFGKNKLAQRIALCQTGHLSYMIVCVEGPEQKSRGFTCMEMADLCYRLEAVNAYNLDGGSSSALVLNNKKINAVGGKKRPVGDMIWFGTLLCQ